ncbi:nucleotidyltransferase family protein [Caminibacter sp.]
MSIKQEVLKYLRENKDKFEKKYGIKKIYLFGSVARGGDNEHSDIDLLVDFKDNITIFELMEFEEELEKKFNKKVDIATFGMLKPIVKKSIQKDILNACL